MAERYFRSIHVDKITLAVAEALKKANWELPDDVVDALRIAYDNENESLPKQALEYMLKNLEVAKSRGIPVCQDTGVVTVKVKIGHDVHIIGGTLEGAINLGIKKSYLEAGFRASVVADPLYERKNTLDNTPAVVHIEYVQGEQLQLFCMPKGFGSENMSCLKMFSPGATEDDIIRYVKESVKIAGANPCPPILLGIGIGGTFDSVAQLAKEALFLPIGARNEKPEYAELEDKIMAEVNSLHIGPQGFGGNTTALAVHVKEAPTHVAGLPVAICFSCYATRRVEVII